MKTLMYSSHAFDQPYFENSDQKKPELTFTEDTLQLDTVKQATGYEAVVLFATDLANTEIVTALHQLGIKFIALRSVGYDHVDLTKAKELGMKVANVPAYSPHAIAEHAVMLLLALVRKLSLGQAQMEKNDFRLDNLVGFDLFGKTVGIIGTGAIGATFAKIMGGFGCKLLGVDPVENKQLIKETGIRYASLVDVCKEADILSIHCPLSKDTHYLLDTHLFSGMKKGVVILNTARGGIIKTADLIDALNNEIVAFAGLDVYENEKNIFFMNHEEKVPHDLLYQTLIAHPNVLITAHQAFITKEALEGIAKTTIENLSQWSLNGHCENDLC